MIRIFDIGMAKLTLDLFYPHMNLMAERNRLLRAYVGGVPIEKVKEQDDGRGGKEGEKQRPPVPLHRLQETVL